MLHVSLSKREKGIFMAAVVFASTALFYNFIFEPAFKKWEFVNSEIKIKRNRLNKSVKLLKDRNFVVEEYNKYAKSIKNISEVLRYVENFADSLNIKTSNMKPSQAEERGVCKEYAIELQMEGRIADIIKFLSELVKPPILAALKKFDLRLVSQNPPIFKGTVILSKIII